MKRVILNIAASLDGYIEGPRGEFDWCFTDQDYGLTDFMKRIDTIFFGRKSFELLLRTGRIPFPDKRKCVFSTTMRKSRKDIRVIDRDVADEVGKIKEEKGGDIWLFGGTQLITTFINHGLVEEMQLAVHPLLLGQGKSLFNDIRDRQTLKLLDTKTYPSGLVQLTYEFVVNPRSEG